jgi:hypothetical protein
MTYQPYQLPPGLGTTGFLVGDNLTSLASVTIIHQRLALIDRPTRDHPVPSLFALAQLGGVLRVTDHRGDRGWQCMGKERRGRKGGSDRKRSIRVTGYRVRG